MMSWEDDIRQVFPEWQTPESLRRWPEAKARLRREMPIQGKVIACAPFGVWIDARVGFPALLLLPHLRGEVPNKGDMIEGYISALGDEGEIGVTQVSTPGETNGTHVSAALPELKK